MEAIRITFTLDKEKHRATDAEREVLEQYSGFGGIKCILNPAEKESDNGYWTKSDLSLFPMIADLFRQFVYPIISRPYRLPVLQKIATLNLRQRNGKITRLEPHSLSFPGTGR